MMSGATAVTTTPPWAFFKVTGPPAPRGRGMLPIDDHWAAAPRGTRASARVRQASRRGTYHLRPRSNECAAVESGRRSPARDGADDRLDETRDVVGLSGGDDRAVLDDGLVHVKAAGVLHVDGDRRPAGHRTSTQGVHRDQELRSMTDGRHGLAGGHGVAYEIDHGMAHPRAIGRKAARNDDGIKVLRTRLARRELSGDLRAALSCVRASGER